MDLPSLDCHAHVSVSVTERQLRDLGNTIVFAMTREPAEAVEATRRYDRNVLWACGAHPNFVARGGEVDAEQFLRRSKRFAVVGEIGLDRRSGNLPHQLKTFDSLVETVRNEPLLLSIHSTGCSAETVRVLRKHKPVGAMLHWFTGSTSEATGLLSIGAYFSVNTAMRPELLRALPLDRLLPETDYPVARKRTGAKPGDTAELELLVGQIHGIEPEEVRRQFYRNLRRLSVSSGAIDRMPTHVAELLLLA